jgi:hypothetical protein
MYLSRQAALEDLYQLVRFLVESHPDPYFAGGGLIAFHRRVEQIVATIPENGLEREDYLRLLRPLVASIEDGHTWIGAPVAAKLSQLRPWIGWDAVEQQLYVATVYRPEEKDLLGGRLQALEHVFFVELVNRINHLYGCDNEYQQLVRLATAFNDPSLLADLLQCRELPGPLHLTLLLPDGSQREVELPLFEQQPGEAIEPSSAVSLPFVNASQLGWSFLDAQHQIAYLRTTSMMHYREAFEASFAVGNHSHLEHYLDDTAHKVLQGPLPASTEARIAAIPSATELLCDLFTAMQQAQTSYLLVDVRQNTGGNSLFASMLEYFLFGLEGMIAADDGYQIKRYSPLYMENVRSATREVLQSYFNNGGYDFTEEEAWWHRQKFGMSIEERECIAQSYQRRFSALPTFAPIFEQRQFEAAWTPHVLVLTSAFTYSAGFDMALVLLRHGAKIIGVPSAQAGNCFIDALYYHLDHSALEGAISFKRSVQFPNAPEQGRVLRPEVELTYAQLAAAQFDPHTTVRFALERFVGQ